MAGTRNPGLPPTMCEWLMPFAARALADLAQVARDAGRDPDGVLAEVDDLTQRFPRHIVDLGGVFSPGLEALYQAEVARARRAPDAVDRWASAARTLRDVLP